MSPRELVKRARPLVHYVPRLEANERFMPRPPEHRRDHGPFFYLFWMVGPMLLVGLGGIMFWLGWR